MSFLRDFPGTDLYQGDLGWIICKIKEFQGLADTIKDLQSALDNLPGNIQQEVNRQLEPIINNINNTLNNFGNRVDSVEKDMSELKKTISQLISWVAQVYGFIENYTDLIGQKVFNELRAYIDNWSKELPPVKCPVDGNMEPINVALEHIYNFYNMGITAAEYDGLQITAEEYDKLELSAREYDAWGRYLFERIYSCMMVSPFTGEKEKISVVVDKLADFHKKGITAQEYDDLELSAEAYDALNMTAYEYDWENTLKE